LFLATVPAWYFKKRGMETQGPLVLWRTKKGLKLLDKFAKYRSFWADFSDLGIIFCFGIFGAGYLLTKKNQAKVFFSYILFALAAVLATSPTLLFGNLANLDGILVLLFGGFSIFVLYALTGNTLTIISNYLLGIVPLPGVAPIIPGLEVPGSPIFVPLSAVVSLVILIIVHEFSHGIIAITEKIRVKSLGLLTLGIFPIGAFTEPDEKQLNKIEMHKRMRVFSAGSMMNFVFAFAFLGLFIPVNAIINPQLEAEVATHSEYYLIRSVTPGSPAALAGIVNGTKIYNAATAFQNRVPGKTEILNTDKGNIAVIRDSTGAIGVTGSFQNITGLGLDFQLKEIGLEILLWTATLNFLIGAINYLPFAIFDGARMFEDMLTFYSTRLGLKDGKIAKKTTKFVGYYILLLFVINVLPYFVKTI